MDNENVGLVAVVLLLVHSVVIRLLPLNVMLTLVLNLVYIVGLVLAAFYNHVRGSGKMVVLFLVWTVLALVWLVI